MNMLSMRWMAGWVVVAGVLAAGARAQKAVDTAAAASPLGAPPKGAPVVDGSVAASPEPKAPGRNEAGVGVAIPAGTVLRVKLAQGLDSGKLANGTVVKATLAEAVQVGTATAADGTKSVRVVPAGAAVEISVVGAVAAQKIASAGEMSLQVTRVGRSTVFTDVQTIEGKEGHKDVADSAPAPGTDAALAAGAVLTFKVQADPAGVK